MNSSSCPLSSTSLLQQQDLSLTTYNATPHLVTPTVLTMCEAIMSSSSSFYNEDNWFSKVTGQPQTVIITPSLTSISFAASHRAVRIQVINKHDDITPPPLPPITTTTTTLHPAPLSSTSVATDESTSALIHYLTDADPMPYIFSTQQDSTFAMNDTDNLEALLDAANNYLMDFDQPHGNNGQINTPLPNFATSLPNTISTPPYFSDFLSF